MIRTLEMKRNLDQENIQDSLSVDCEDGQGVVLVTEGWVQRILIIRHIVLEQRPHSTVILSR